MLPDGREGVEGRSSLDRDALDRDRMLNGPGARVLGRQRNRFLDALEEFAFGPALAVGAAEARDAARGIVKASGTLGGKPNAGKARQVRADLGPGGLPGEMGPGGDPVS